jgi:hypothetical protein
MKRLHALTIVEVLVVIGLLVPAVLMVAVCAHADEATDNDKQKNAKQLKDIMMAFVLWSDANTQTGALPGVYTTKRPPGYPLNATDPSVVGRFWALVAAIGIEPIDPRILVNPTDGVPKTPWSNPDFVIKAGKTTAAAAGFGPGNVSYALLSTKLTGGAQNTEWHNNVNAGCPLICDRNRGTPAAPASSWSKAGWQGDIAWGDTHVTFENAPKNLNETICGNATGTNDLWAPATSSNGGMVNPGS